MYQLIYLFLWHILKVKINVGTETLNPCQVGTETKNPFPLQNKL